MKQIYILEGNNLDWFKENYSKLGGIKCSEYLKLPAYFLRKKAIFYNIKISKETRLLIQKQNFNTAKANKQEKIKKICNEIRIDSKEKAYVLGFLWGDGYLNCPKKYNCCYAVLEIQKEDFDNIISYFKCFGEWKITYRNRKETDCNRKIQGSAVLCDSSFGLFLKNNNYKNKSQVSPNSVLSIIPDEFKKWWWRGYVDADGCFYINKTNSLHQFSLAGSYEQDWSEVDKLFKGLNIKFNVIKQIRNNHKHSIVRISNRCDIIKLGKYIYSDIYDEIGLNRKYNKYNDIISSYH